jgi:hypothetical protein
VTKSAKRWPEAFIEDAAAPASFAQSGILGQKRGFHAFGRPVKEVVREEPGDEGLLAESVHIDGAKCPQPRGGLYRGFQRP